MHTRMHATRDSLRGEDRPERQAASQRLRDRDHVRQYAIVLVSEVASGAPQSPLDLIQQQPRARLLRQAASQRLRDRDHVRQYAIVLVSEVASGAPQSTLDLIQQQQRASLLREARSQFEKFASYGANSTFPLNRLNANCANARIKLLHQVFEIVKLDERHTRHQRNKRSPIFRLP